MPRDNQDEPSATITDRYGRPGKGNDKGNVEGVVGYARRNFMTPLPRFASWDAFNGHLEEQCRNRQPAAVSNRLPVRGTVDRALEPGWVDKGLQQQQRMAETGRPVTHDPTRAQTEKP